MGEPIKYPLGEQDFERLIQDGFVYIDKTHYIEKLLRNSYYFLSRPRRFGKSLFLSTLEQFFLGKRELFKGLAVDKLDWDWEEYPIIRIDLSNGSFSQADGLESRLNRIIDKSQEQYQVKTDGQYPGERFDSLISQLFRKFDRKVVVLIDEYEKPLLDTFDKPHHDNYINQLRDFYSVLKENSRYIQFLFITGVTRFGHLNIFSGLNNLTDISLEDEYAGICGITQDELLKDLSEGIADLAKAEGSNSNDILSKLAEYYDGYHFSGKLLDVYNPYSVLNCLAFGRFTDKWFQTGSPTFLWKRLQESGFELRRLDFVTATENTLLGNDALMGDSLTLLYQSGYLTIKSYDSQTGIYTLGLPNKEVTQALYQAIIPFYTGRKDAMQPSDFMRIATWISKGEIENVMTWLTEFFARVSYDMKLLPLHDKPRQESDFQFMVYAILALSCGVDNVSIEQSTSGGRMDLAVELPEYVYVFEFKLGDDASLALRQIENKRYADRWAASGKTIIKVGVAFSSETLSIICWETSL